MGLYTLAETGAKLTTRLDWARSRISSVATVGWFDLTPHSMTARLG